MPVPGADMTANAGAPDPMGADPNIGAGVGNVANDPNAGMPTEDPGMEDTGMGMEGSEAEGGDDSTASIIDQLSDDDKEAVRNYAKSLLNRDEANADGEAMPGMEEPAPAPDQSGQGVMMEITKGRLKKVQQHLSETFRSNDGNKDETDRRQKKVKKNVGKKSPFDSPLD